MASWCCQAADNAVEEVGASRRRRGRVVAPDLPPGLCSVNKDAGSDQASPVDLLSHFTSANQDGGEEE